MAELKRFLVERDIGGIGGMSTIELCGAARASNLAIEKLAPHIQWSHSYIAGDKAFCIYLADSEQRLREHGEMSGFPVTQVTEIPRIIDPLTANE